MAPHPDLPGLFAPEQPALPLSAPAPATERQIAYARTLASRTGRKLPQSLLRDRAALSAWIDQSRPARPTGRFAAYPSSKQVAFAERIARLKQRQIPDECFRDRTLMSRWIDGNMPR